MFSVIRRRRVIPLSYPTSILPRQAVSVRSRRSGEEASQTTMAAEPEKRLLMLYDGKCNVCNFAVRFTLPRVRKGHRIEYASLQSAYAKKKIEELNVDVFQDKKNPDVPTSSVVVENGKAYEKLDASIVALRYMHGLWPLLSILLSLVPKFMRDAFYDWFARNRFKFFGGTKYIQAIPKSKESLFLDADEGIHVCPRP